MTDTENKAGKVRVDKWLWAARFFKTRSLAKTAIEGGKVQMDGQRVKVSREVAPGDVLRVRQGWDEHEIVVSAVTDETPQSVMRRARAAEARKAAGAMRKPTQKPGKHERKALQRLRKQFDPS